MVRIFAICSLVSCLANQTAVAIGADGPSKQVPELKVLDHYVGTWDIEVTSKGQPFTKGKVTVKWILGGRFVQQSGDLQAKDGSTVLKVETLMTYDTNNKAYRSWTFLSDGTTFDSEGTWNAKDKVMTSVGGRDETDGFSTTTADFSKAGVETWKIVRTNGAGTESIELSGKNTRRKK